MGPESVHIDEFGKVLGNYKDGDNGVYAHQGANSSKDYQKDYDSKTNTAAAGKKIRGNLTKIRLLYLQGCQPAYPSLRDSSASY